MSFEKPPEVPTPEKTEETLIEIDAEVPKEGEKIPEEFKIKVEKSEEDEQRLKELRENVLFRNEKIKKPEEAIEIFEQMANNVQELKIRIAELEIELEGTEDASRREEIQEEIDFINMTMEMEEVDEGELKSLDEELEYYSPEKDSFLTFDDKDKRNV